MNSEGSRSSRPTRSVVISVLFVLLSRAAGLAREAIVAVGYGLSSQTDLYYQLTAPSIYALTFMGGPFTTAYISSSGMQAASGKGIDRFVSLIAVLSASVALCICLGVLEGDIAREANLMVSATISAFGAVYLGYFAARLNALGRFANAQGVLFSASACFLIIVSGAIWFDVQWHVATMLVASYAVSIFLAVPFARYLARKFESVYKIDGRSGSFWTLLSWALLETLSFVGNQAVLLYCASIAGVGYAAGSMLTQRVALAFNAVVISPLSTGIMVHLVKQQEGQRRVAVAAVIGVSALLTCVAAGLYVFASFALDSGLVRFGALGARDAAIISLLLPGYCIWLVAQGTSMTLSRVMFAMGVGRRFTFVTVLGYAVASFARVAFTLSGDFPTGLVAGATVELLVALTLAGHLVVRASGMMQASE